MLELGEGHTYDLTTKIRKIARNFEVGLRVWDSCPERRNGEVPPAARPPFCLSNPQALRHYTLNRNTILAGSFLSP